METMRRACAVVLTCALLCVRARRGERMRESCIPSARLKADD